MIPIFKKLAKGAEKEIGVLIRSWFLEHLKKTY
jgi:hypothetical protein